MVSGKAVYIIIIAACTSFVPFQLASYGRVDIGLFKVMLALSVVVLGATATVDRKRAIIPGDRLFVLLLLLLAYALLSGFWAGDALLTLQYTFGLSIFVLFYFMVLMLTKTREDILRWVYCIPLAVIVAIAVNLGTYLDFPTIRHAPSISQRVGLMGVVAAMSVLPLAYVNVTSKALTCKIYSWVILIFCGVALIVSANRMATIVAVFNIMVFSAFMLKARWVSGKYKTRIVGFLILTIVAAIVGFLIVSSTSSRSADLYTTRILGTVDSEYRINNQSFHWRDSPRILVWGAGIRMAGSSPLSGVGFGNYKARLFDYLPYWESERVAHNIYLSMIAETGPLGLALLILLLGFAAHNYRSLGKILTNLRRENDFILVKALEVSFWGLLIHAAFRPMLYEFTIYLFMALSFCCRKILTSER